jgi:hypothetical protein
MTHTFGSAMHTMNSAPNTLQIGGVDKTQLLDLLTRLGVSLNDAARTLFASNLFTTLPEPIWISYVELSVLDLGFDDGATFPEIQCSAESMGYILPPVELGAHLRLQYSTQAEGYVGMPVTKPRAPPGSITIASAPLTEDDSFPKGFYLRRINGALWLRGYWSGLNHVWSPEDCLIFQQSSAESGRRGDLTPAPHTTGHTGP